MHLTESGDDLRDRLGVRDVRIFCAGFYLLRGHDCLSSIVRAHSCLTAANTGPGSAGSRVLECPNMPVIQRGR